MMKQSDWLKTRLIAHRGLHSNDESVPENSMLSFQLALKKGYGIELDVNVLKDGTVVAFHDISLKRLCNDNRMLSDLVKSDLNQFTLLHTTEKIPLFEEILSLVHGQVPLLIELKPHGNIRLLCESLMKSLQGYLGPYAIFSFHPKVVYWFKKHYPDVLRGQIAESFRDEKKMNFIVKWMMKHMVFNILTKPDFISYGIKDLPNKMCDKLMKKNMTVISYAAQSQAEFDHVKTYYHNVVFECFEPKIKG